MCKSDIADAFRLIPLHPSQYPLMGLKVNEQYYYDRTLPMGSRSACRMFERFSSGLQFILESSYQVSYSVKMQDDFLFLGYSASDAQRYLDCFTHLCNKLGVPIASHRTLGPTTNLTFLGIELDTKTRQASLPKDKIAKYREPLNSFSNHTIVARSLS